MMAFVLLSPIRMYAHPLPSNRNRASFGTEIPVYSLASLAVKYSFFNKQINPFKLSDFLNKMRRYVRFV